MTMKRAECDIVVYGKAGKTAFSGDINGDGLVDGLESGKRVYLIDKDQHQAIIVSARAFIDSVLSNKRWALLYGCTAIVVIPMGIMALLSFFNPTPRYLTTSEAGGMPNAWAFNGVSAVKEFTGVIAEKKVNDIVAENTKKNDDVAFSPRQARAERR